MSVAARSIAARQMLLAVMWSPRKMWAGRWGVPRVVQSRAGPARARPPDADTCRTAVAVATMPPRGDARGGRLRENGAMELPGSGSAATGSSRPHLPGWARDACIAAVVIVAALLPGPGPGPRPGHPMPPGHGLLTAF